MEKWNVITSIFTDEIFNQLIELYKKHKNILGLFPFGAFEERRKRNEILVSVDNDRLLGYLLYRTNKEEVIIVHLCINQQERKLGVARKLIDHLIENTKQYYGIGLHCRRDYDASQIWPSLGFIAQGDKPGRSYEGKLLTKWCIEHKHPNLFNQKVIQQEKKISIIIDSNIFFDFFDKRSIDTDDSKALLADWIQEYIEIKITPELKNEINRQDDNEIRKKSHSYASNFNCVDNKPQKVIEIYSGILEFYKYKNRTSDMSDIRQLSHAIANECDYFITKDQKILSHEDEVMKRYNISIQHPVEFISKIDQNIRSTEYQPLKVKSSQYKKQSATSDKVDMILSEFLAGKQNEKKSSFKRFINIALANPNHYECVIIHDGFDNYKALYVIDRTEMDVFNIPIIRVVDDKNVSTISRFLIQEIISIAIKENRFITTITDKYITPQLESALADSFFTKHNNDWVKISIKSVDESSAIIVQLNAILSSHLKYKRFIENVVELINTSLIDDDLRVFIQVELLLFPAKFTDFKIPGVIIPIKPFWAENLFDYELARENIFGAKLSTMLDFENVYYRSGRGINTKVPSRILWYISFDRKYELSMEIRACSYLDDIVIDYPKVLYKQFNRLGVYEWDNLYKLAKNNIENKIMALKFSYSEVFDNPVNWEKMQNLLIKYMGKSNQIQSPVNIPHEAFIQIYKMGYNQ